MTGELPKFKSDKDEVHYWCTQPGMVAVEHTRKTDPLERALRMSDSDTLTVNQFPVEQAQEMFDQGECDLLVFTGLGFGGAQSHCAAFKVGEPLSEHRDRIRSLTTRYLQRGPGAYLTEELDNPEYND